MEITVPTGTELTITKPTEFERVMARVKKEILETETSLQNENYMRQIIKEIASVYFFLRKQGLGYSPITIEEFEVTQEYLLNLARRKTSQFGIGFFRRAWRYYLRNKFFSCHYSPFGNWMDDHPWSHSDYNNYNSFDLSSIYGFIFTKSHNKSLPPNLNELAKEILKKRYVKE